jgi:leucyl-tRNA synthetase
MFMGPLDRVKPWSMQGVKGVYNFISKAYRFFNDPANYDDSSKNEELEKLLHKTIKKVTGDIENFRFNTAISQLMIFTNAAVKQGKVDKTTGEIFAKLLSPFTPHAAEEIWQTLGHNETITYQTWPTYKEELTVDDLITIGIQVNGKTRSTIQVSKDISKEDFLAQAKADEKIQKFLAKGTVVKEIYVPGRICNFVVK